MIAKSKLNLRWFRASARNLYVLFVCFEVPHTAVIIETKLPKIIKIKRTNEQKKIGNVNQQLTLIDEMDSQKKEKKHTHNLLHWHVSHIEKKDDFYGIIY